MSQQERFIVTGGAGFIGSNLVARLLARSPRPDVIVIDNFRSGSFGALVGACERIGVGAFDGRVVARSTARIAWARAIERTRPTAVFHLGAITDTTLLDEGEMLRENVGGFASMLRACDAADVPLVYASSAAVYGTPAQTRERRAFPESAAGRPSNVYGFSKWLMECEHRRLDQEASMEQVAPGPMLGALTAAMERLGRVRRPRVVGLRYFNVFGPGEAGKGRMASMPYQLATRMLAGQRPRIFEDGSQARDQVHVDDVVSCTIAAAGLGARTDPAPGVYNLGSGVATSFNQVVRSLREALGVSEASSPTDYFEMPDSIRAFYQDYTCADLSRTQAGLGWRPALEPARAIEDYGRWLGSRRG
jgi:ADP-L-glycero-D-manno-heptose 6-epimerase